MALRVAVPGAAAVLGATAVLLAGCASPVPVDAPALDDPALAICRALLGALPDTVDGQERREVSPPDAAAAAWGDPAIVLRCGVPPPAALADGAPLFEVDGTSWLPEPLEAGYLFTSAGRTVHVEVAVPDDYAPEVNAVVDLVAAVTATVPEAAADG